MKKHAKLLNPNGGGGASVAFTLAEVLITLGIIGVVAALTMPALINNIQDRQFRAMFKKQVSIIFQAIQKVISEDGEFYIVNAPNTNYTQEMRTNLCKIMKELKTVKSGVDCSTIQSNRTVMWHKIYQWYNKKGEGQYLNGGNDSLNGYTGLSFLMADGALINYNCWNEFFIDVNGYKGPNTIGRDIFYFYLPINGGNAPLFFGNAGNTANVNGCSGAYAVPISKDNYEEDCKSGSGWGCSPKYFLE